VVAGKADYMSPEQASFKITDKRSDLFSAGVVLSHLVLGYNIFKGATPDESRERIMTLEIPDFRTLDSRVDDRLNRALHRALDRSPHNRYPDADELLYELEHYIYHSGYGPTNETLGKFIRELFDHKRGTGFGSRQQRHPARSHVSGDPAATCLICLRPPSRSPCSRPALRLTRPSIFDEPCARRSALPATGHRSSAPRSYSAPPIFAKAKTTVALIWPSRFLVPRHEPFRSWLVKGAL
jgi:serine/threonine protein kinase